MLWVVTNFDVQVTSHGVVVFTLGQAQAQAQHLQQKRASMTTKRALATISKGMHLPTDPAPKCHIVKHSTPSA